MPAEHKELSAEQMAATVTSAKRVLVTATPGAGKTTTLVARMREMLARGIEPRQMVCVTFTRHAAAQLRERIGDEGRRVVIGTLHAFCLRLIREMGATIGYEWDWASIIDDEDSLLEQYDALTDLGLMAKAPDGKRVWKGCKARDWEKFVEGVTAGLVDPESEDTPLDFRRAWTAYMDRLRSQNTLTYGTILTEAYRLLQDRKALGTFRRKYRHFLIDEAQDTSHLQWSVVWRLVGKAQPDSLFVVGDLDQSIYEWRGAAPRDMLAFAKAKDTTCYTLATTYRFGAGIGDPAQRLIDHNRQRLPTVIKTLHGGGRAEIFDQMWSIDEVAQNICLSGYDPHTVAVLSRRHAPLIELEERLTALGVKVHRIGKAADIRRSREFRVCMAYCRCAANPRDRQAFARIATIEGITADQMRGYRLAASEGEPIASQWFSGDGNAAPWRPEDIEARVQLRDKEHDYTAAIGLLREAVLFQGCNSAGELVRYFALADVQDEIASAAPDAMTLCTTHGAKGLEWPTVIVIDVCEGTWPSASSEKEGRLEEERRLLYVAMTRARDRLLVFPTRSGEELKLKKPSRFIAEIGATAQPKPTEPEDMIPM